MYRPNYRRSQWLNDSLERVLPGAKRMVLGPGRRPDRSTRPAAFSTRAAPSTMPFSAPASFPCVTTAAARGWCPTFQPLLVPTPTSPVYLGEDYAFCERACRAGYKVFATRR